MSRRNSVIATILVILVIYFLVFRTKQQVFTQGLKYCESIAFYDGGLLIGNFGSDELNPLNEQGKGYIAYFKENEITTLINSDGNLNAPKGMLVNEEKLYICDVNKLVIYNLQDLNEKPQIVSFPEADVYLNDIVLNGENIYVSVTNTGNIYKLALSALEPELWLNVVGANGLAVGDDAMYVASYPADGVVTKDNVIYKVSSLDSEPKIEKFITTEGSWDGLALTRDGKTMYASNWTPASVVKIDMKNGEMTMLNMKEEMVGVADITVVGNLLCIPDLVLSKIIIRQLK